MNENIRIAKELIKLAKLMIANEQNEDYNDQISIDDIKEDDGFCAIGIINNNEQIIDSGINNKDQIIKQAQKELRHYQKIEIYSRGKLIKTIK